MANHICLTCPHFTNFSGDKKAWEIYMTIGNILSRTRNRASKQAAVLLALLSIPPKMLGVTTRDSRPRQVHNCNGGTL